MTDTAHPANSSDFNRAALTRARAKRVFAISFLLRNATLLACATGLLMILCLEGPVLAVAIATLAAGWGTVAYFARHHPAERRPRRRICLP